MMMHRRGRCQIYLKITDQRIKGLDFPVRPTGYPVLPAFPLQYADSDLQSPGCFSDWKMEVLCYVNKSNASYVLAVGSPLPLSWCWKSCVRHKEIGGQHTEAEMKNKKETQQA
jgi:hypothetical protein